METSEASDTEKVEKKSQLCRGCLLDRGARTLTK